MKFSGRKVTSKEYKNICKDFRKIEVKYKVPESNSKRINITVEEGKNVIGFASGLTNHKWFNLTDLWICEKYRNQGLGEKILAMLEEKVKNQGINNIYTWTTAFNSNEKFYEKQGYKQSLVFENFFEVANGHHICLIKDLKSKIK